MQRITFFIFFCLISIELSAQGFNTFNERNHPYLEWQVAETEHFKIIYPSRISGIEAEAAAIAEESYRVLSKNLEIEFDDRIRIYLSDEDEINNGFAVPIGNGYTNIWVGVHDYAEIWTGQEKWLRKVISHELAHIFHFQATRTNLGLMNYIIGNPSPDFWAEGLAQYQTERWDSQRGDRWLRLSVFDSRPEYDDGQSVINTRLMYASGHSQMRYFTESYGDSTLAEMLRHRSSFLGGFQYHDFDEAFRDITGNSYADFYEDWLKHINIYYNTLASMMERVDSLGGNSLSLPGQFYYDIKYSPDQSQIAVLSLPSLRRPVRSLHVVDNDSVGSYRIVADGHIHDDLVWSQDGRSIAFSRRVRGDNGSLVNDLFMVDLESGEERRLTNSRRARWPAFGPDGRKMVYVVNNSGTGNVAMKDLETGEKNYITHFRGDVQVIHLKWNHNQDKLVFQRFDEEGNRHLVMLNPDTGTERILDEAVIDNRHPVISPDGSKIAFTSLRDEVPNVFITDLQADTTWRVTNLFTGGEVLDWLAVSDTLESEKLVVKSTETKRSENIYLLDADRKYQQSPPELNRVYSTWRTQEPAYWISSHIDPDESLVSRRYDYNSLGNLTHALSFVLPYYAGRNDYGLFGSTTWVEPLGKHLVTAAGALSFGDFSNSYGIISYINNQFYPTLSFSAYRTPGSARFYGGNYLVENMKGGDLSAMWPINRLETSYRNSRFGSRLRFVSIDPHHLTGTDDSPALPDAEAARQLDLRLSWMLKEQRPWYRNRIHPLDGYGIRLMLTGSEKILGSETSFFTADASAYTVLPSVGTHKLYLYGRVQAQIGNPLPQNYIGFSRFDNIDLPTPAELFFLQTFEAERVRGYRDFVAGRQVAFTTAEYRMLFLPSLNTSILGLLRLGPTALAFFADAGLIRDVTFGESADAGDQVYRLGIGAEIKNHARIGGIHFIHSIGFAQPYNEWLTSEYDLYYRIKASVPF